MIYTSEVLLDYPFPILIVIIARNHTVNVSQFRICCGKMELDHHDAIPCCSHKETPAYKPLLLPQ